MFIQGNIFVTDNESAVLADVAVYTEARRWILFPSKKNIKNRESFRCQAPEFVNPDKDDVFTEPTKAMDVYAFASFVYTVSYIV